LKVADQADPFVAEIRRILGIDEEITSLPIIGGSIRQIEEQTARRWYPVIDFDRCTNCMECIDFCLFGVYGVDHGESILVEQPDNCRKGCPACSRVCPENAIIFPQHKAPAIAGAEVDGDEGFKIDLSQLFGAPDKDEDPIATAARERDEQLLLAGRDAVGIDDQLKRRQADRTAKPKDQLDALIDSLDALDL
jgi:MinD superfamily P-loop ATPase